MRNLYTNHGLVLLRIWLNPTATLSEIAADIGTKERAVYLIVRDLVQEGFIAKRRVGRRNQYRVDFQRALDFRPLPSTNIRDQITAIALTMGMRLPESEEPTRGGADPSAVVRPEATRSAAESRPGPR